MSDPTRHRLAPALRHGLYVDVLPTGPGAVLGRLIAITLLPFTSTTMHG